MLNGRLLLLLLSHGSVQSNEFFDLGDRYRKFSVTNADPLAK